MQCRNDSSGWTDIRMEWWHDLEFTAFPMEAPPLGAAETQIFPCEGRKDPSSLELEEDSPGSVSPRAGRVKDGSVS